MTAHLPRLVGPSVRALPAALVVTLLTSRIFGADNSARAEIRTGLLAYTAKAPAAAPVTTPVALANPSARTGSFLLPNKSAVPPATGPAKPAAVFMLPRMVVHGTPLAAKPEPPSALPRLSVRPAGKDLPAEPFETPEARDARLVKKHLSTFDRVFLNRFTLFGGESKEKRARGAEAIEQSAQELNAAADLLELNQRPGHETAEDRKLREAYLDAFVSRPK